MNKRTRRLQIIARLVELSRDGWAHANPDEYRRLEAELETLQ
jgi:hypothetical protein